MDGLAQLYFKTTSLFLVVVYVSLHVFQRFYISFGVWVQFRLGLRIMGDFGGLLMNMIDLKNFWVAELNEVPRFIGITVVKQLIFFHLFAV